MSVLSNTCILSEEDSPSQDVDNHSTGSAGSIMLDDSLEELPTLGSQNLRVPRRRFYTEGEASDLYQTEVDERRPSTLGRSATEPFIQLSPMQDESKRCDDSFPETSSPNRQGSRASNLAPLSTLLRSNSAGSREHLSRQSSSMSPRRSFLGRFLGMSLNRKVREMHMPEMYDMDGLFSNSRAGSFNPTKKRGTRGRDIASSEDPFTGLLSDAMLEEVRLYVRIQFYRKGTFNLPILKTH